MLGVHSMSVSINSEAACFFREWDTRPASLMARVVTGSLINILSPFENALCQF